MTFLNRVTRNIGTIHLGYSSLWIMSPFAVIKFRGLDLHADAVYEPTPTHSHRKSITFRKIWWFFIFAGYCFSLAKVHSIGESLNQRATTGKAHIAPRKRLKHVTNDSRLDLSFIIVSDTCPRHRPLFCRLRNNNMLWHVSPGPDFLACIVGCTKANRRKRFEEKSYIMKAWTRIQYFGCLANMIN